MCASWYYVCQRVFQCWFIFFFFLLHLNNFSASFSIIFQKNLFQIWRNASLSWTWQLFISAAHEGTWFNSSSSRMASTKWAGWIPRSAAAHSPSPAQPEVSGGTRGDCPARPQPNVCSVQTLLRTGLSTSGMHCPPRSQIPTQSINSRIATMPTRPVAKFLSHNYVYSS